MSTAAPAGWTVRRGRPEEAQTDPQERPQKHEIREVRQMDDVRAEPPDQRELDQQHQGTAQKQAHPGRHEDTACQGTARPSACSSSRAWISTTWRSPCTLAEGRSPIGWSCARPSPAPIAADRCPVRVAARWGDATVDGDARRAECRCPGSSFRSRCGLPVTRVLIVEDERPLLRALAMNLTARGFEVVEADTGSQGLAAAAVDRPDVILLDLGLPDVSGLDVIRGVRAYSETPIVVLSARTGSSDKIEALDIGADDYITKPFNIGELLARLRCRDPPVGTTRDPRHHPDRHDGAGYRGQDGYGGFGGAGAPHADGVASARGADRPAGPARSGPGAADGAAGEPEHTDSSYLRIYVAQLRRKLEPEPSRPRYFITEPGMGYRFQP